MKNSSDTTGNQTSDIRACSTVPQPTVALHTQEKEKCTVLIMYSSALDGCNSVVCYLWQITFSDMLPMPSQTVQPTAQGVEDTHEWYISLGAFSFSNSGNNLIFENANTSSPLHLHVKCVKKEML
jgi:hypothetical protein